MELITFKKEVSEMCNVIANERKEYTDFSGQIAWGTSSGNVQNATFSLLVANGEKIIVWRDGTWCNGKWANGIWQSGIWNDGTWECGIWLNGTWKNGKWVKGWNSFPLLPKSKNDLGNLKVTRWEDMIAYDTPPSEWQIDNVLI